PHAATSTPSTPSLHDALPIFTVTTANGTYITTVPVVATATDNSTVISGDLTLLKEQALDANLDGSPDGAYGTTDITTGALPGKADRKSTRLNSSHRTISYAVF